MIFRYLHFVYSNYKKTLIRYRGRSYFKQYSVFSYLLIFAHESLSVTVRLNTGCSGVESVSGQK